MLERRGELSSGEMNHARAYTFKIRAPWCGAVENVGWDFVLQPAHRVFEHYLCNSIGIMSDQLVKSPRFKSWVSRFFVDSVPVMSNVSPILTSA